MAAAEPYVHGYSLRESERLGDQAQTLSDLLHGDQIYPVGSLVLEAGCGVGAQTVILTRNNPDVSFISVDISPQSLEQAQKAVKQQGSSNVHFQQADIFQLPFDDGMFDAVFVCFVLEHLSKPLAAIEELKRVLKPGGIITVIEGDHGSAYFYPDSMLARRAIQCLVELQAAGGGDALIGRQLYPLLLQNGFERIGVSPRVVYVDSSRPQWVQGFTRNTFTAMVEGVGRQAVQSGMMDTADWEQAIADLYRTSQEDGVFNYTFFKATGVKPT
jgi:SAM-dependent methyltransferase